MKKVCLFAVLVLCLMVNSLGFAYAQGNVVERPDFKIMIDGKISHYDDVPVVLNDRTLLPLREVLTNLGVQNDDQHIVWNSTEKSVTVHKDGVKIYVKIGSQTAYVNGEQVVLDTSPVIHKSRTYIPARFVAQSLGKKVVWDKFTNTALIRDQDEYNKVKEILEKSNQAQKSIKNCTLEFEMVTGYDGSKMTIKAGGQVDNQKKQLKLDAELSVDGMEGKMEIFYYLSNNKGYAGFSFDEELDEQSFTSEQYNELFSNHINCLRHYSDTMYAGLAIKDNGNPNEIFLKGNVYLNKLNENFLDAPQGENFNIKDKNKEITKFDLEIVIDKNTNLIKRISMVWDSNEKEPGQVDKVTEKLTIVYSNYNGDSQITPPAGVNE